MNSGTSPGTSLAPPREGVHLSVFDDLDDLLLDRRADARQLLGLSLERELRDRRRRIPDARRSAPIGEHTEALFSEQLREVGEQVELIGDVRVAGKRAGHGRSYAASPP